MLLYAGAAGRVAAETALPWTLEQSILHAAELAPEMRGARAAVTARVGALRQAGAWPNPAIELRVDNRLGRDDGAGGTDFTQLAVSQALPVGGRLAHQRAVAAFELDSARAQQHYQFVNLEVQVAKRFHTLQLAAERLRLAERRLQLADELQRIGRRRQQAGELSYLERLRLDLIRESAQQILDKSEGAYNEAQSNFRAYVGLAPESSVPQLVVLEPFDRMPALTQLHADLLQHTALLAAKYRVDAAQASVDLARVQAIPDPSLRFFHERDVLNGRRQDVTGVGVGISVPLWDRNAGRIDEARAQVIQAQAAYDALYRDLRSRIDQSYLHLNHLVEQGDHFRESVFGPAHEVFALTRKAYAAGELEVLALIDANTVYFDAHDRYLELLQEAWQEAADLRLAAGRTLVLGQGATSDE